MVAGQPAAVGRGGTVTLMSDVDAAMAVGKHDVVPVRRGAPGARHSTMGPASD